MLNLEQINVLGNILNTSWGKGVDETFSCTAVVQGDFLKITYSTFANLASESAISRQTPLLAQESSERISALVSKTKKIFKEKTGSALPLKEQSNSDSVELVQATTVNPRRIILYRRRAIFQVG